MSSPLTQFNPSADSEAVKKALNMVNEKFNRTKKLQTSKKNSDSDSESDSEVLIIPSTLLTVEERRIVRDRINNKNPSSFSDSESKAFNGLHCESYGVGNERSLHVMVKDSQTKSHKASAPAPVSDSSDVPQWSVPQPSQLPAPPPLPQTLLPSEVINESETQSLEASQTQQSLIHSLSNQRRSRNRHSLSVSTDIDDFGNVIRSYAAVADQANQMMISNNNNSQNLNQIQNQSAVDPALAPPLIPPTLPPQEVLKSVYGEINTNNNNQDLNVRNAIPVSNANDNIMINSTLNSDQLQYQLYDIESQSQSTQDNNIQISTWHGPLQIPPKITQNSNITVGAGPITNSNNNLDNGGAPPPLPSTSKLSVISTTNQNMNNDSQSWQISTAPLPITMKSVTTNNNIYKTGGPGSSRGSGPPALPSGPPPSNSMPLSAHRNGPNNNMNSLSKFQNLRIRESGFGPVNHLQSNNGTNSNVKKSQSVRVNTGGQSDAKSTSAQDLNFQNNDTISSESFDDYVDTNYLTQVEAEVYRNVFHTPTIANTVLFGNPSLFPNTSANITNKNTISMSKMKSEQLQCVTGQSQWQSGAVNSNNNNNTVTHTSSVKFADRLEKKLFSLNFDNTNSNSLSAGTGSATVSMTLSQSLTDRSSPMNSHQLKSQTSNQNLETVTDNQIESNTQTNNNTSTKLNKPGVSGVSRSTRTSLGNLLHTTSVLSENEVLPGMYDSVSSPHAISMTEEPMGFELKSLEDESEEDLNKNNSSKQQIFQMSLTDSIPMDHIISQSVPASTRHSIDQNTISGSRPLMVQSTRSNATIFNPQYNSPQSQNSYIVDENGDRRFNRFFSNYKRVTPGTSGFQNIQQASSSPSSPDNKQSYLTTKAQATIRNDLGEGQAQAQNQTQTQSPSFLHISDLSNAIRNTPKANSLYSDSDKFKQVQELCLQEKKKRLEKKQISQTGSETQFSQTAGSATPPPLPSQLPEKGLSKESNLNLLNVNDQYSAPAAESGNPVGPELILNPPPQSALPPPLIPLPDPNSSDPNTGNYLPVPDTPAWMRQSKPLLNEFCIGQVVQIADTDDVVLDCLRNKRGVVVDIVQDGATGAISYDIMLEDLYKKKRNLEQDIMNDIENIKNESDNQITKTTSDKLESVGFDQKVIDELTKPEPGIGLIKGNVGIKQRESFLTLSSQIRLQTPNLSQKSDQIQNHQIQQKQSTVTDQTSYQSIVDPVTGLRLYNNIDDDPELALLSLLAKQLTIPQEIIRPVALTMTQPVESSDMNQNMENYINTESYNDQDGGPTMNVIDYDYNENVNSGPGNFNNSNWYDETYQYNDQYNDYDNSGQNWYDEAQQYDSYEMNNLRQDNQNQNQYDNSSKKSNQSQQPINSKTSTNTNSPKTGQGVPVIAQTVNGYYATRYGGPTKVLCLDQLLPENGDETAYFKCFLKHADQFGYPRYSRKTLIYQNASQASVFGTGGVSLSQPNFLDNLPSGFSILNTNSDAQQILGPTSQVITSSFSQISSASASHRNSLSMTQNQNQNQKQSIRDNSLNRNQDNTTNDINDQFNSNVIDDQYNNNLPPPPLPSLPSNFSNESYLDGDLFNAFLPPDLPPTLPATGLGLTPVTSPQSGRSGPGPQQSGRQQFNQFKTQNVNYDVMNSNKTTSKNSEMSGPSRGSHADMSSNWRVRNNTNNNNNNLNDIMIDSEYNYNNLSPVTVAAVTAYNTKKNSTSANDNILTKTESRRLARERDGRIMPVTHAKSHSPALSPGDNQSNYSNIYRKFSSPSDLSNMSSYQRFSSNNNNNMPSKKTKSLGSRDAGSPFQ